MVFTSVFPSRPLSISSLVSSILWRPVPSLPSDFFSFPTSAFPSSMGAFPGLVSDSPSKPCTRFRSFSTDPYSLVNLWCVTLSFWWTVPLFLLFYLCEVFLYGFIISFHFNLSIHFLKFFQDFLLSYIPFTIFSFYEIYFEIDSQFCVQNQGI